MLLSVAVSASLTIIKMSYDIPEIIKYVDFINLMTYDLSLFKWYTPFVTHNSALFSRRNEISIFSTFNTAWAAQHWIESGVDRHKLMIGIPTYGRQYKLLSKTITRPGSPAVKDLGEMKFAEICKFLKMHGTVKVFDEEAKVPYAYNDDVWITFEDEQSITYKVNWIKSNGFGGVMTYSLNHDDYDLTCQKGKTFPLHHLINQLLKSV